MNRNIGRLRRLWNRLFDQLMTEEEPAQQAEAPTQRAIAMGRVYDQLWNVMMAMDDWAYPLDVYVEDDGSLFAIVTQGGKLFRVSITVDQDSVSLGDWVQVMETFEPVQQRSFVVRRQADGKYRWLMIAATSVLNRVGEIDSSELFDSFIRKAEETGKYPRLDFYHLGSSDPKMWEFGTADYLARDGICYIASGLFDEDHPLAEATIRAAEREPGRWGASIEFWASGEPELVLTEPEVRIPVYKEGENTRISVVLEEDAAGLFTRLGVSQEVTRMNENIMDKLRELFGDDETALKEFAENVDTVNRMVKEQGLIHRDKQRSAEAEAEAEEEDEEEGEEIPSAEESTAELTELVLDEEAMRQLASQVVDSGAMTSVLTPVLQAAEALRAAVPAINDMKDIIERQNKIIKKLEERVALLERDDEEKQQEWLEDLPARRQTKITYRPRDARRGDLDEEAEDDLSAQVDETLKKLAAY